MIWVVVFLVFLVVYALCDIRKTLDELQGLRVWIATLKAKIALFEKQLEEFEESLREDD